LPTVTAPTSSQSAVVCSPSCRRHPRRRSTIASDIANSQASRLTSARAAAAICDLSVGCTPPIEHGPNAATAHDPRPSTHTSPNYHGDHIVAAQLPSGGCCDAVTRRSLRPQIARSPSRSPLPARTPCSLAGRHPPTLSPFAIGAATHKSPNPLARAGTNPIARLPGGLAQSGLCEVASTAVPAAVTSDATSHNPLDSH
jgi:hypothetical protein